MATADRYILQCPRCRHTVDWCRAEKPEPGKCPCGSWQAWKVVKEHYRPMAGFVRLLTDSGWKRLR